MELLFKAGKCFCREIWRGGQAVVKGGRGVLRRQAIGKWLASSKQLLGRSNYSQTLSNCLQTVIGTG